MTIDRNKSINAIVYNHLNLPLKISFANGGTITYFYNAIGQKIKKVVLENSITNTTDYLNGYQYKNSGLQFFPTAEGYVNFTASKVQGVPGKFNYAFNYVDHLGNVRMTYSQDPISLTLRIMEENHYYPFGLKHSGYNSDMSMYSKDAIGTRIKPVPPLFVTSYQYKYNGKELQDELGLNMYDYGNRLYYPARAGWSNIDPLAEKMRRYSPYNYCFNNPLRFTDPDGMAPTDVIITGDKAKEAFKQLQSSTSLKLKMDDNGKVTASGNAKTDADKKLQEATTDTNVVVNVNATSSNFTDDGHWFVGGAFGGSKVDAESKIQTSQTVNPEQTKKIDEFYGAEKGVSVLHEVIESYIGGKESPGIGGPTFDDVANKIPNGVGYLNAHDKTEAVDPRHIAPTTSQDPTTGQLYINKPHSTFPQLNVELIINDLSKKK